MKKKIVAAVLLGVFTAAGLTGCRGFSNVTNMRPIESGEEVKLRVAHDNNVNTPLHASFLEFERLVEEKTDGKVDVIIFPAGQMGSVTDTLEQVRRCDIEMSGTTTSNLVQTIPEFAVWESYFMFDDYEQAHAVLDSEVGMSVMEPMKKMGVTGLGYMEMGFRNFSNSKRPIEKAEDVKGIKMRGYNPMQITAWESLGAVPTNLAFNEVFTSLQQHLIDGQECATSSFFTEKFYEAQDYWSLTKHTYTNFMVYINTNFLESLPEDYRSAIQESMEEAIDFNRQKVESEEEENLEHIKDSGTKVNEVSDEERAKMGEIMNAAIKDDIIASCGQELYDKVMDEIAAVKK